MHFVILLFYLISYICNYSLRRTRMTPSKVVKQNIGLIIGYRKLTIIILLYKSPKIIPFSSSYIVQNNCYNFFYEIYINAKYLKNKDDNIHKSKIRRKDIREITLAEFQILVISKKKTLKDFFLN